MLKPFLKWAGGKTWLVHRCEQIAPAKFKRYIEPFLGSGAVFFHLNPRDAILSDKNVELINTYRAIRKNAKKINTYLASYHEAHSSDFYYEIRDSVCIEQAEAAARFLYLNRVCFNGLYRVNRKGQFNVPLGSKSQVTFPEGYLSKIAARLRHAKLITSDFEDIIDAATADDFIYVDPPYTVSHNNNGFIKYNDVLFSWADQIRLAACVSKAAARGVQIFVSNADHEAVRQLYSGFTYRHTISRTSVLSGDPKSRRSTTESAFLNYHLPTLQS